MEPRRTWIRRGRGRVYVCRAFATFAEAISVLINKRRRAPCLSAATLLCAEMSFGTSVTSFPALCRARARARPRVSVFWLVNNLNEGAGQSRRAALSLSLSLSLSLRQQAEIHGIRCNARASRAEPSRIPIDPCDPTEGSLTRLTLFSGQVQSYRDARWCTGFLYRHSFLNSKMLSARAKLEPSRRGISLYRVTRQRLRSVDPRRELRGLTNDPEIERMKNSSGKLAFKRRCFFKTRRPSNR